MGWSWRVHIVQALHLEVFRRAGLGARFLQDKLPPGSLDTGQVVRACCIDNVATFSVCRDLVQRDLLVVALRDQGIVTHDEEGGDELALLGDWSCALASSGRRRPSASGVSRWPYTA